MLMPSRTVLLSIALLAACAILWIATGDIPGPTSWQSYGSAIFPRILIGILAALTGLLLVRELLITGRSNAFREIGMWFASEYRIFAGMVVFALYIYAMPRLGFIVATPIYLAVSLSVFWVPIDRRKLVISAVICLGVTFSVHVVFETVLGIRLP